MAYEHLLVETADGVTTITINRPQALNVLTPTTMEELEQAFVAARHDPAVRVVILTGSGEKAFVAGGDIREAQAALAAGAASARETFARRGLRLMAVIERLGKPVIAAVNGYALGGGSEIVQACHLALAAETAMAARVCSEMGVSRTRSGPNSSSRPSVALNTPPAAATSSPRINTRSSAARSSCCT